MSAPSVERLRQIKTFPSLVKYLRDELEWPIETENFDELTFDYHPDEFGLDPKKAVKIKEIKQLRPLATNQPWGIFFINFEKKQLPVVVMRLLLRALVIKKRASANRSEMQAWQPHDLLFISACGEEDNRTLTFAHFVENPGSNLTELRVLGWDDDDTPLHMDYVAGMLQKKLHWDDKVAANPEAWRKQWSDAFLIRHRHVITTSTELAIALAQLAKRLRTRIRTILRTEDESGEIRKLQRSFQTALINDLDDDGFADMFAQTVTYGLFSVSVRRTFPGQGTAVNKEDVPNLVFTSPFLRDMLGVFLGLKSRQGKIDFDQLGVSDVTDLLTSPDTHMEVVLADFNNKTQGEDPVIHFYEHFLSAYNKQLKIQRGVFYTPQPVVSYIVRSVHELLQSEFGLADGLADTATWGEMLKKHPGLKLPPLTDEPGEKRTISADEPFVQILDPATGTATFLVEVIDVIHRTLAAKWKQQRLTDAQQRAAWNDYVPQHLLPRLHAFELMMAPYAIAHMKIGLKLAETGYRFGTEERARIYLTNALEPWVKQLLLIGFDALAHEAAAVNEIKRHKRFTVVIGNPPYSNLSANLTPDARALVEPFKFINGERIRERGALSLEKNLNDDYVKFVRLAQQTLHGVGVTGLVTNSGFMGNPTLRGMRWSLLETYSRFVVLNLLGYAGASTRTTGDVKDENVFDIANAGVAIHIGSSGLASGNRLARYAEVIGSREKKYEFLSKRSVGTTEFVTLAPTPPFFLLEPTDAETEQEYEQGIPLLSVFKMNSTGIRTLRDGFVVSFDDEPLIERVTQFRDSKASDESLCTELNLEMPGWWNVAASRKSIAKEKDIRRLLKQLSYRPFDVRTIFYHESLVGSPRRPVMQHMEPRASNLALHICRQLSSPRWEHVLVTRGLTDDCYVSNRTKERGYTIPLYLRAESDHLVLGDSQSNCDIRPFQAALHSQDASLLNVETVFGYVYAILFSPTFRTRYLDFLKRDFPRLPLTGNLELFRALARLGGELTALHLLESPRLDQPNTEFIGARNPEVEKVSWSRNTVWVDKAQTTGFRGVREPVWNFHIGGYQVCEKWLKDRKGRTLTKDDLTHYHKIVVALSETIRIMAEIDKVVEKHGGWPGAFASGVVVGKTKDPKNPLS